MITTAAVVYSRNNNGAFPKAEVWFQYETTEDVRRHVREAFETAFGYKPMRATRKMRHGGEKI